jgi:hypothetical protein
MIRYLRMKLDRVLREMVVMRDMLSFATLFQMIEWSSEGVRYLRRGRMRLNGRQRGCGMRTASAYEDHQHSR